MDKRVDKHLNRYIKQKHQALLQSGYDFSGLFSVIHNQKNHVFAEYMEDFVIHKITYQEFETYTKQFATYLSTIEDPKDSYIAIYMENSINWVSSFWAILMLGYRPLLLNAKLPTHMNEHILRLMDVKTIITNANTFNGYHEIILPAGNQLIKAVTCLSPFEPKEWGNHIALCSTATSMDYKVCVYSGADFTHQVLNTKGILSQNQMIKKHYDGALKVLAFLPYYHIFGLVASYLWFAVFGRTMVFLNDYSSETILKTIRSHRVTHVFAVPLLWNTITREIMANIKNYDEKDQVKIKKAMHLSIKLQSVFPRLGMKIARQIFKKVIYQTLGNSIQYLISGGGYISDESLFLINAIGYPIFNGYGATEIGITSVELRQKARYRIEGSVGKPFDSVTYKIEDGILHVQGKSLCSRIIFKNGESKDIDGHAWFNTHDMASIKRKHYFIHGREDDVYIGENGEKINPDIIEKQILFTTIQNFSVLTIDQRLSLVIEIKDNIDILTKKKVYDEVIIMSDKLHEDKFMDMPIYFTYDPIINPNAVKVSRRQLLAKIAAKEVMLQPFDQFIEHQIMNEDIIENDVSYRIRKIFSEVLGKNFNDIELNNHFMFDLGGSSLDYFTLLSKLQKEFNMNFNLENDIFYTVKEFANYIMGQK